MRVLLVNPPSSRTVIRGNYCNSEPKAGYYYPPIDLLIQSAVLDKHFDIEVIDAMAERLTPAATLDRASHSSYDAILFTTGSITYEEDLSLVRDLRAVQPRAKIVGSGDVLLFDSSNALHEGSPIDAALMDFTSDDVVKYVCGEWDGITQLAFRNEEGRAEWGLERGIKRYGDRSAGEPLRIGIPRHDLFPFRRFSIAHARRSPVTLTMFSFGCPYTCEYCPMERIYYKTRAVDEAVAEMHRIQALGIREVFLLDQTFGCVREDALEICQRMREDRIDITWTCLSRADVLDSELIKAMKSAGCHTIQFGVETANPETLWEQKKRIPIDCTRAAFRSCKEHGIRTVGHFVLGLPGDYEEEARSTLRLAIELDCDYAAFNIAEAAHGTTLRERAFSSGLLGSTATPQASYLSAAHPEPPGRSFNDVLRWRKQAVRGFYARPRYLAKRLFDLRSWNEVALTAKSVVALLKQQIKQR